MYRVRITDAEDRNKILRGKIKALEETEQRLVLVQDRIKKVDQISKVKSANKELEGFEFLLDGVGPLVNVDLVNIDTNTLDIKISSDSTIYTLDFINFIENSNEFSNVTIQSMQFTPKTGFTTQILLKKQ